jgi:exopolysaccharide production protein ExoQ
MTGLVANGGRPLGTVRLELRLIETAVVLAFLLIASGTLRSILLSGDDDREAGSILFQLVTLTIYGSAAVLTLRGVPAWFPRLMVGAWPLLLLTGLALISVGWSDAPSTTMRRAIALVLTTGFAFYVVARFEAEEFIKILAVAFSVFFGVAVLAAALPGVGITPSGLHDGAWRGLTGQKNEFGRTCGLALTFFLVLIVVRPRVRRQCVVAAAAALALLILSTSKTPITATAVGLGGTAINCILLRGQIGKLRFAGEMRAFLFVAIVALVSISVFWLVPLIVEAMGRDLTFSGRTELWKWAIANARDTPWFGSGYRGFWNDHNTRYFFESFAWGRSLDGELSDSYSGPTHGHSGYVDLWLELGWIGVVFFAGLLCSTLAKIARCFRAGRIDVAFCLSAITWFLLSYAFTAKSIMQQSEDLWFIYLVFYLYAERVRAVDLVRPQRRDDDRLFATQSHSGRQRAPGW